MNPIISLFAPSGEGDLLDFLVSETVLSDYGAGGPSGNSGDDLRAAPREIDRAIRELNDNRPGWREAYEQECRKLNLLTRLC
ncbi:MAG: hypothetical protein LBE03_00870 [Candidatus Nomurabacteria bacterium]|jgi:hypothetical protein|nr:hypothetical protein [Candidatus Nomurabacteria bacterium]